MEIMLKRFLKDESAATAVEYGLIIGVLSLAIIGGLSQALNAIQNNFEFSSGLIENPIREPDGVVGWNSVLTV